MACKVSATDRPDVGIGKRRGGQVLKLQMGADNVELACLSILNELSANCRENLETKWMLGLS